MTVDTFDPDLDTRDPFAQTDEEKAAFKQKMREMREGGMYGIGLPRRARVVERDGCKIVENVDDRDGRMDGYVKHRPDGSIHSVITPLAQHMTGAAPTPGG